MGSTTSDRDRLPKPVMGNWRHLLAFGFGAGCSPKAPGTMGTLLAVVLYLPLSRLPLVSYALVLVAVALVGIWLCGRAAQDLGVHDHPASRHRVPEGFPFFADVHHIGLAGLGQVGKLVGHDQTAF